MLGKKVKRQCKESDTVEQNIETWREGFNLTRKDIKEAKGKVAFILG